MIKYDSYQNSGIEWIGEIPSHWKKIPLGKVGVFYGVDWKKKEKTLPMRTVH